MYTPGLKVERQLKSLAGISTSSFLQKLGVQSGTDAIEAYRKITRGELTGELAKEKEREMIEYCKLDTYAMYVLWKFFCGVVDGV